MCPELKLDVLFKELLGRMHMSQNGIGQDVHVPKHYWARKLCPDRLVSCIISEVVKYTDC